MFGLCLNVLRQKYFLKRQKFKSKSPWKSNSELAFHFWQRLLLAIEATMQQYEAGYVPHPNGSGGRICVCEGDGSLLEPKIEEQRMNRLNIVPLLFEILMELKNDETFAAVRCQLFKILHFLLM